MPAHSRASIHKWRQLQLEQLLLIASKQRVVRLLEDLVVSSGASASEWAAAAGGADLYAANESSPSAQPSATGANAVAIGEAAVAVGVNSAAMGKSAAAGGLRSAAIGDEALIGISGVSAVALGTTRHGGATRLLVLAAGLADCGESRNVRCDWLSRVVLGEACRR